MAIAKIIKKVEETFGEGIIFQLTGEPVKIKSISTGSNGLDDAIGVGGLPLGRIVEIYGNESSGKTTLCLHTIAEAQKLGYICAFIDTEHALDIGYAKKLGVQVDNLLVSQPDCGEQALEVVETLIRTGEIKLIVIDSVAALTPRAEIEGDMGDSVTGNIPIFIRDKYTKQINFVSIASLYNGTLKTFGRKNLNAKYKKLKEKEVLTNSGWKNLKEVSIKSNKTNKNICLTNTLTGITQSTYDHSLFSEDKEKAPSELKIGESINQITEKIPEQNNFLNKETAWILGFFCAEGHKISHCKNVFSVSNTNYEYINKFQQYLSNNFPCLIKIKTNNNVKGNRKPLHTLSFSRNEYLSAITNDCIDFKIKEKKIPQCVLNSNKEIMIEFMNGYRDGDGNKSLENYSFCSSSMLMMAGISFIFNQFEWPYHINSQYTENKKPTFNITQVDKNLHKPNKIRKFINLPPTKYLYDIGTEDGTFVGGIGNIVHHNSHMGLQARLMSQALRKLTAIISKSECCVVFTNQIRSKIGVMFGNPETTTGGNALKFYASVRLDIRRKAQIKQGDHVIGNEVTIKVVKNKVAPPFKEVHTAILYGKGIWKSREILNKMIENEEVEKAGAWFKYKDNKFQGEDKMIKYIEENILTTTKQS